MSRAGEVVERWVPGVRAARTYQRPWLRSDFVAGLVLAAILVPQGMAYAELAGLPAVTGLYTTIGCLVGYALFGPSRVLVLGPDSSVSPLIFAAIIPLTTVNDPATAIALAGMLALIVGLIEIGLGIGKLGFVADLLSKEVQVGYMMGLGVTIVVGQLPKLFGFSTDGDDFIEDVKAFVSGLDQRNRDTLIVGVAFTMPNGPKMALISLIFLVVIHKLEYFLNSKIIGDRIRNPMWLTLVGIVLGEKLMGIPGMILAPVVLHYIKVEASKRKMAETTGKAET